MIRTLEKARVAMERNGVDIRVAADILQKRYYPDIYEWLKFQCSIWMWTGSSFPAPDDVRLAMFAEPNATESGEIEPTHHVVWGKKSSHAQSKARHPGDLLERCSA